MLLTKYGYFKTENLVNTSSFEFMGRHKRLFETAANNLNIVSLKSQTESLRPTLNMLEEQNKIVEKSIASSIDILNDQSATLIPTLGVLEEQNKILHQDLISPITDILKAPEVDLKIKANLLTEQGKLTVDSLSTLADVSGILNTHEKVMGSIDEVLVEHKNTIEEPLIALNSYILNFDSITESSNASIFSSLPITEIYESTIEDFKNLYEAVEMEKQADTDVIEPIREFLRDFIAYCKKFRSLLNTLNSEKFWGLLHKAATLYTIYIAIISIISSVSGTDNGYNNDGEQIEEQRYYDIDDKKQNKNEQHMKNDKDKMKISPGMRT